MMGSMTEQKHATVGHERLLAAGLVIGFLALVASVVGIYLVGITSFHGHVRVIVPAIERLVRMPTVSPAGAVLALALIAMVVAFVALLIRDAREGRTTD